MAMVPTIAHKPSAVTLNPSQLTANLSVMAEFLRGAKRHRAHIQILRFELTLGIQRVIQSPLASTVTPSRFSDNPLFDAVARLVAGVATLQLRASIPSF
jgi:hypothetical protein